MCWIERYWPRLGDIGADGDMLGLAGMVLAPSDLELSQLVLCCLVLLTVPRQGSLDRSPHLPLKTKMTRAQDPKQRLAQRGEITEMHGNH